MILPKGFQFSQSSLQDYVDCPKRFLLRHVHQLPWPAVESEPLLENERYAQRGKLFHKMIQQHLIGIPEKRIASIATHDELENWWQNYLEFYRQQNIAQQHAWFPEIVLKAPLGGYSLIAAFDLIVHQVDDTLVIYDWKTNHSHPSRLWLERRLQTRVYLYLLAKAGNFLLGGRLIQPENIRMVYWFAAFPSQPETFVYDTLAFTTDEKYLENLVETIEQRQENDFYLTDDNRYCQYCVYRSLCERGIHAGCMDDDAEIDHPHGLDENEARFDFDQITEIAF